MKIKESNQLFAQPLAGLSVSGLHGYLYQAGGGPGTMS